ncbi:hypothetical protein [Flavobacterium sp.]|uniref:hypothetical protein n=1 Tax=Flavobacterium sp. TaxID=239 RepID=UPI00261451C0|nr:hypothetical protein [Flavobacterium sp.]
MKNKFNYLFKALFIFISLLFLGCETQEEVVSSSKNYKKYEISVKEFNNDQQARFTFEKVKEKQKTNREAKKGNEQQRILYNKEYDFFIDTDKIVVIEIDDFKSYTFQIHRPEENAKLENLVINSKNNTTYKTYITKYNVTELEKQILSNNGYVDVTDGLEIEALDESKIAQFNDGPCNLVVSNPFSFNNLGQVTESYYAIVPVPCGTEGATCPPGACGGGGEGSTDTNQGNTGTGYNPSGYTPNFNEGNGGVGSFPTGNNPNGSNQPGGGTNSSNVFVSAPTVSLEDSQVKAFIKSLTDEQRDFLFPDIDLNNLSQNDNSTADSVIEYLTQNDFSEESQEYVEDCIDASINFILEYGNTVENQNLIDDFIDSVLNNDDNADSNDDGTTLPPDCASFNFTSPSSTINWQQSAVVNIHFTVLVGTPSGVFVNHVIEYPTPILFGMPKNLAVGNTNISPGLAATLSAAALNKAIKETVNKYGNKNVSYMIVERYFESRLKHNFEIGIPGARLNLHPQSYPTPTQYQTNASGIGDCQ